MPGTGATFGSAGPGTVAGILNGGPFGGFNADQLDLGQNPLRLTVALQDQVVAEGVQSFSLPANAFQHTDPSARISIEATLADGSPLPPFVNFDAEAELFIIDTDTARAAGVEALDVRVTGRDTDGNEASAVFRVRFTADVGEAGLEIPPTAEDEENEDSEATPEGEEDGQPPEGEPGEGPAPSTAPEAEQEDAALRPSLHRQLASSGSEVELTARDQLLADLEALIGKAA